MEYNKELIDRLYRTFPRLQMVNWNEEYSYDMEADYVIPTKLKWFDMLELLDENGLEVGNSKDSKDRQTSSFDITKKLIDRLNRIFPYIKFNDGGYEFGKGDYCPPTYLNWYDFIKTLHDNGLEIRNK